MLSSPNDESPANVEAAVSLTIFLVYNILLLKPSLMVHICILEKKRQTNICHETHAFMIKNLK